MTSRTPVRDHSGPSSEAVDKLPHDRNLTVRRFEDLADLESLAPNWSDLLAEVPSATIFSTWEWLGAWWRAYGEGQHLIVLAFYDSTSRLVGLALFGRYKKRLFGGARLSVLRLMGDGSGDSDNLDIPVRPGYEAEVASELLRFVATQQGAGDLCEFNTLPLQSSVGEHFLSLLKERGWTHLISRIPCSVIVLPESWESYLAQISSKERGKIRYYTKRLEKRYEVRFCKCSSEDELLANLKILFDLHQKRWERRGEPGSFGSPERRRFYHEMGRAFLSRQWLEFWVLELDGKAVAAEFNFRYRDTVYALQSGFDPGYADDSVAYVLKAHLLEQLIAAGIRRYDFLGGQASSKDRWQAQVGSYLNIHVARPFSRGSAYLQLVSGASASKEWLRARLPARTWGFFRRVKHVLRGEKDL